jgi:tetratricopeptide (TPR) repeat protein
MLFLSFREVTRGRWRRARWSFWAVTVCALALYMLTAARHAFPGHSASWIAWATGLDVRETPTRPVLALLGGLAARLPWGTLAVRLNLLSALVGALAIGWAYRVVWFVAFDVMREESAVTRASRIAQFAGAVAAVAVATSLPFWQAATRFTPEVFDAAWVLACAHLLTVYARSRNLLWLMLFSMLFGIGLAESPLVLVAAPVLAYFAVLVEWRLYWCRIGRLFGAGVVASLFLVMTHGVAAHTFAVAHIPSASFAEVMRVVLSVLRDQVAAVRTFLPSTLWLPAVGVGVVFAALSLLSAVRMLDNRRTWGLVILGCLLTLSAACLLLGAPFAPGPLWAAKGVMPATTYVVAGLGLGLLAASWRAYSLLNDPKDVDVPDSVHARDEDDDDAPTPQGEVAPPAVFVACRAAGFILGPVLLLLIGMAAIRNGLAIRAERGVFADRAADAMLDGLNGRSWVVANGLVDPHLLIRAHERGLALNLLCPYRATQRYYVADVLQKVSKDATFSEEAKMRAQSLMAYNLHMFIDDLFATDQEIGRKAVCMGLPDIWYGSGWVPVPERLFYGGVKALAEVKADALRDSHQQFWAQWKPFLDEGDGSPSQLSYRYRVALRRHLAFVANNLGVALDDLGRPEEAFEAYRQARAFSPENISALLNVFELVSRGLHQELKDAVSLELRRRVENPKERYPLWALSRHYGYVRNFDLFVRMGWAWAVSSSPGSVLAGLRGAYSVQQDQERRAALTAMMASVYEMRGDFAQSADEYKKTLQHDPKNAFAISGLVRLALQRSVVGEAQEVLKAGEFSGVSRRLLRQDWAAVYLVSGDLSRARVILQEMGDEQDASPMTLAMLAMVMIEQQDVVSVETKVLPRMIKSSEGKDSYFVQVVQGRVWQSKGKEGYRNARLCYHRAASLRPDVQALRDVILMLDASLEDQKAAEAHALAILRERPEHPFANFVMGSIRLEQARYGEAEQYLGRSVAGAEPTLAALNNYAQTLCRILKLDEAEAVARKAVACAPGRYEAWSTLAFVLVAQERLDEAAQAMAKAYALNSSDVRLLLVDGQIALKRGNRAAAEKAAAAVAAAQDLSAADRRELKSLTDALARPAQPAP